MIRPLATPQWTVQPAVPLAAGTMGQRARPRDLNSSGAAAAAAAVAAAAAAVAVQVWGPWRTEEALADLRRHAWSSLAPYLLPEEMIGRMPWGASTVGVRRTPKSVLHSRFDDRLFNRRITVWPRNA
jgi:post-segregation antitoxin (ccd killing protein)